VVAPGTVLVGSDGSWRSAAVLDVAAREASVRGARLAVLTVLREAADPGRSLTALLGEERHAADLADWRLREAVARVRGRHPALEVLTARAGERELAGGTGLPDAAALPDDVELLVVGARGAHAEPAFGLGTISSDLLRAVGGPVLVVPERVAPAPGRGAPPPVVAAVGDRPESAARVLAAARREAARHGTSVVALHAYRPPPGLSAARARQEALERAAGAVSGAQPGVPVRLAVTDEPVLDALLRQGAAGSLLVIGTRGTAALAGLSAESVTRPVLADPPCPVLVLLPGPTARRERNDGPARHRAPAGSVVPEQAPHQGAVPRRS